MMMTGMMRILAVTVVRERRWRKSKRGKRESARHRDSTAPTRIVQGKIVGDRKFPVSQSAKTSGRKKSRMDHSDDDKPPYPPTNMRASRHSKSIKRQTKSTRDNDGAVLVVKDDASGGPAAGAAATASVRRNKSDSSTRRHSAPSSGLQQDDAIAPQKKESKRGSRRASRSSSEASSRRSLPGLSGARGRKSRHRKTIRDGKEGRENESAPDEGDAARPAENAANQQQNSRGPVRPFFFSTAEQMNKRPFREQRSQVAGINVMKARKRSALISILFVDLPFLVIRSLHYYLSPEGTRSLETMTLKNLVCLVLQAVALNSVQQVELRGSALMESLQDQSGGIFQQRSNVRVLRLQDQQFASNAIFTGGGAHLPSGSTRVGRIWAPYAGLLQLGWNNHAHQYASSTTSSGQHQTPAPLSTTRGEGGAGRGLPESATTPVTSSNDLKAMNIKMEKGGSFISSLPRPSAAASSPAELLSLKTGGASGVGERESSSGGGAALQYITSGEEGHAAGGGFDSSRVDERALLRTPSTPQDDQQLDSSISLGLSGLDSESSTGGESLYDVRTSDSDDDEDNNTGGRGQFYSEDASAFRGLRSNPKDHAHQHSDNEDLGKASPARAGKKTKSRYSLQSGRSRMRRLRRCLLEWCLYFICCCGRGWARASRFWLWQLLVVVSALCGGYICSDHSYDEDRLIIFDQLRLEMEANAAA
eukprot:GSA25T00000480001.1